MISSGRVPGEKEARRGALTESAWINRTSASPVGSTAPAASSGAWAEGARKMALPLPAAFRGARRSPSLQTQSDGVVSTAPSRLCRISSSRR